MRPYSSGTFDVALVALARRQQHAHVVNVVLATAVAARGALAALGKRKASAVFTPTVPVSMI
ncbi:hypothetical protein SKZ59_15045 [Janthinobacterium sp. GMG2]|uniref:hypothetical protein n=1 Tax=Janthinobacterium sp. GMG2 TaxID=3096606 RepID=UPI0029F5750F|nr:hypothetical protein [Janthinobacterium sp. GMG2]MDX8123097.1 hypothetical protein [Janthinobacterium sp. GMG2]